VLVDAHAVNFLVTTFFDALVEPVELVRSRGIVLDNPRTDEELDYAHSVLGRAVAAESSSRSTLVGIAAHSLWPDAFQDVRRSAWNEFDDDRIPHAVGEAMLDSLAEAAAAQIVLYRFDDEGATEGLRAAQSGLGRNEFVMLAEDSPLFVRASEAFQIGHLLSLLTVATEDEGELYETFLLSDTPEWSLGLGSSLASSLLSRCLISARPDEPDNGLKFASLRYYQRLLMEAGRLLDPLVEPAAGQVPILYAGELLSIALAARDERTRLLSIVAMLELLLTRRPDAARFNVEDSLTKQFVLKLGVVHHLEDEDCDIELVRRASKELYAIRSSIAHGNFADLERQLKKSSFSRPDDDADGLFSPVGLALDRATEFGLVSARLVLRATIQHPAFLEFLKTA
jgi:hypothetical protein